MLVFEIAYFKRKRNSSLSKKQEKANKTAKKGFRAVTTAL
jgi:hypothetical protein